MLSTNYATAFILQAELHFELRLLYNSLLAIFGLISRKLCLKIKAGIKAESTVTVRYM